MDGPSERVPESASPLFEAAASSAVLPFDEHLDLAREINARRAQLENPELLRRLRSL